MTRLFHPRARRGRPALALPNILQPIATRIPPALMAQLVAAALASGHALSVEIRQRLAASFQVTDEP